MPRQLGKNELPPYHNNLSRGFAESLVGFIITLAVLKMGQFGKRRLNFLGALIMGFSFFIFKFIAKTVHRLVYFSLIMLPTTGLLIAGLFNLGMGGVEIAVLLHEFSAFLSYVVIALHVGASLYSRFKGEGLWNAMVPIWKETEKNNSNLISRLESIEKKTYEKIEKVFNLE